MIPASLLTDSVTSYPVFEANQLLTDRNLNRVVDYLDQQDRLTRIRHIGSGIVCSLEPRIDGDSLTISGGCGITSEGLLVFLEDTILTHYRTVEIKETAFLAETELQPGNGDPTPTPVYTVFELFKGDPAEPELLTSAFMASKVVVLLLEGKDEKNEFCQDDCQAKGTERSFNTRILLVDKADVEKIITANYEKAFQALKDPKDLQDPDYLEDLFLRKYELPDVYLKRFAWAGPGKGVIFTDIPNHRTFVERYQQIINEGLGLINPALGAAHKMFSPVFTGFCPDPLACQIPSDFADASHAQGYLDIQYRYDYLYDLALAYDEFRTVAFDLMDDCCPDAGRFPRQLLLGEPLEQNEELPIPPSLYRTPYTQPPVYNGNPERLGEARLLFERLALLCARFLVPDNADIRITPSMQGGAPLSRRAMPFYYDLPEDQLLRHWDYDLWRKDKSCHVYSYHRFKKPSPADNPPYDEPLVHRMDACSFFRIEGHVGKGLKGVLTELTKQRDDYTLPFDIAAVKINGPLWQEKQPPGGAQLVAASETVGSEENGDTGGSAQPGAHGAAALAAPSGERTIVAEQLLSNPFSELAKQLDRRARTWLSVGVLSGLVGAISLVAADGFWLPQIGEMMGWFLPFVGTIGIIVGSVLICCALCGRKEEDEDDVVEPPSQLHEFAQVYPGLEHKAGVPKGGTFVLVYLNDNAKTVAGDLCLPYALFDESRGIHAAIQTLMA